MVKKMSVVAVGFYLLVSSSIVSAASISCNFSSTKQLKQTMTHPDVLVMQRILNLSPVTQIAATGAGSPGNENTYFGVRTFNALVKFQSSRVKEIIIPSGLTRANGVLGALTRAELKKFCVQNTTDAQTPVPVTINLSPSLPQVGTSPSNGAPAVLVPTQTTPTAPVAPIVAVPTVAVPAVSVPTQSTVTAPVISVPQTSPLGVNPQASSLIMDTRIIPIPANVGYPAKGVPLTDPVTGFTVTRVADKSELVGDYAAHQSALSSIVYARYSPTNTTGEYVLVHGDNSTSAWLYRVSDNKMMATLRFNPSIGQSSRALGEVNEIRWDYTGQFPYRMYFVGRSIPKAQGNGENVGMSFYYTDFNPSTGTQSAPVLIRDFSKDFPSMAGGEIMNDVEGDSSNDSRYWAWQVMNTTLGTGFKTYAVFSYDKAANQILGSIQRSCVGQTVPCVAINTPATALPYISKPNMVEVSPRGTRVVVDWGRTYVGNRDLDTGTVADGPKGFALNFTDPIRIGADETHSGWAWGPNGEEMFVSQNNRNDWIEAVNIATAATAKCVVISSNSYSCGTKLITQPGMDGNGYTLGFHFGKVYDQNKKGYIYMNTYDSNYSAWGKNQNLFIEINDGTVRPSKVVRFGSSYNTHYDYRSEGSGALDFRGENIWTTGNWGFVDGRGDVTRVALPSNWYSLIGSTPVIQVPTPITPVPVVPTTTPSSAINGSCGTSNGQTLLSAPVNGMCTSGIASSVTGAGPWSWTCAGTNGGVTASCQANKVSVSLPVVTISSSLSQVDLNGTAVISWSSQNASTCTVYGGRSGTSGTFTSSALTQATTFDVTCNGPGGQSTAQVTVTIKPQPVLQSPATRVSAVKSTDPSAGSFEATRSTSAFGAVAGNLVVVSVVFDKGEGATGVTISDTAGNNYQAGAQVQAGGTTKYVQQFYVLSSQANASNVVTATYSGKAGDPLEVSAVQYGAAAGKSWVLDGTIMSTSGTGFASGPVVSPSFTTTGVGVISSVATGYYDVVLPMTTGQDTLVHQIENTGWVLERITNSAVSGVTVSTQSAAQSGYGKFALSVAAFKAQ
jgi:hypothetical protein